MSANLTSTQQEGLQQVLNLMETHKLNLSHIRAAEHARKKQDKTGHSENALSRTDLIMRLFAYLGGTLIFAGLGVFIETIWNDLGSLPRVIVTFGSGFTAYILGLVFASDKRFEKAATPAFIMAFLLQPTGLFVFLDEYFDGNDIALGSMFAFGPLALQQALTFLKFRRPALLLFSLLFGFGFFGALTEYADINRGLSALMVGTFMFFISVDLQNRTDFKDLTPFLYILSTILFFSGLYYFIGRTVFDPLALSVILAMLLYAVHSSSKTLYVLSLLYMAGYFGGGPGGGWILGWHHYNELAAIFTGTSLMLAGYWLRSSNYISLFPVWMFCGSGFALSGFYGLLLNTPLEPLFIGASALGIYASLLLRSRAVLASSVLAMIGFIVSFTARHFANTVGWPLLLIFIGFAVLGSGFFFARMSGRIKNAAAG